MKSSDIRRRGGLLAGVCGAVLLAAPAFAQQPATPAQPVPPGSPLFGRPDNANAAKLAPVAPPPIPAAADKLPTGKLKVPAGFNVEVYASGIPNARSMRLGDQGTLFLGNRFIGKVFAVVKKDGKTEMKTIAEGLHRPNGIAFHKGTLFVAELSKVWRFDNIEKNLDKPEKKMIYDDLPKDEPHGWKFISVGPDGKLYVPVGQPGNNVLNSPAHAQIRRINLDGSGAEKIAFGVRNTVGFDWHPVSKQLYFTDNGRDWMSEDAPQDELNRTVRVGQHFGSPYCYQGNVTDPEHGWGRACSEFTPPVALLGPHAAALGMRFYSGKMFPSKYKNGIFIARHGSWNRSTKVGGDIVFVTLNANGTVKSVEPFMTGFLVNNSYIGRPVDVEMMKDGSMLVSDDWNGAVYRVSYGKQKTASR